MNMFVAMTICAGMMSSTWSGLIADGVSSYSFLGIPFRVINYSSSVLPVVFAVLVASYIERFLDKIIPGALKIILVPALTILIATPVTLITVGPLTYWLGEELAIGVNWLFDERRCVLRHRLRRHLLLHGSAGHHHGMVPC